MFHNKIKKHFEKIAKVKRLHGMKAVLGIYLSKVPFAKLIFRKLFGGLKIKTNILGSTMYIDVFDRGLHRRLLLTGIREPEHVNQIKEGVKPGMVGVELGANIGYFGLLEAKLVGEGGMIYCIEPAPDNIKWLTRNIKANNLESRMKAFQYLVGDHDGMEKLYLSEYANVHSLSSSRGKKGFVHVPMKTLDTFMEENKIDKIDFIRMDIEGYEVMAFQGMKKLFESKVPLKIFIEFHPPFYGEWGWTYEKLLRYLDSFGFKIKEIAKVKHTDDTGKFHPPIILKNPTIDEVLEFEKSTFGDGGQAHLERVL